MHHRFFSSPGVLAFRRRALGRLLEVDAFLFPRSCFLCGTPFGARSARQLCAACRRLLIPVTGPTCLVCRSRGRGEEGFSAGRHCRIPDHIPFRAWAAVQMVDPADGLVHALKFRDRPELGRSMALLMARSLRRSGAGRWDDLVPLPLHRQRERSRGYNQGEEIARPLARLLRAGVASGRLVRRRATGRQADLDYEERRANVAGAFAPAPARRRGESAAPVVGRRLLLIDDVATTGHTLVEALLALRQGAPGATGAAVFALA